MGRERGWLLFVIAGSTQWQPLVNFLIINANGLMFIKVLKCDGEYKEQFFIANIIKEMIKEIGHQYVV